MAELDTIGAGGGGGTGLNSIGSQLSAGNALRQAQNAKRIAGQIGPSLNALGGGKKENENQDEGSQGGKENQDRPYSEVAGENRKKAQKEKFEAQKKEESKGNLIRKGTSKVLRWAWITLIPSYFLTLLYIDIHVFCRYVVGEKFFCKLGEEWIPDLPVLGMGGGQKMAKYALGITEVFAALVLNLYALVIILGALGIIAMITGWMNMGILDKIWSVVKGIWDMGWSGFGLAFKALVDLFGR